MRSNRYENSIALLREREVYPPFDEVSTLVRYHRHSKRRNILPAVLLLSLGTVLGATAVKYYTSSDSLSSSGTFAAKTLAPSARGSFEPSLPSPSYTALAPATKHRRQPLSGVFNGAAIADLSDQPREQTRMPDPVRSESAVRSVPDAPIALLPASIEVPGRPSLEFLMNRGSVEPARTTLCLSGGLSPFLQTASSALQNFSAGFRYRFGRVSSLIVELRRTAFSAVNTNRSANYRDTTINVGGQNYTNTIGAVSSASANSLLAVYSIGTGYRLDVLSNGSFTTYAEVGLGAGTVGAVTSERIGLEYGFADTPIAMSLFASGDQLFASGAIPRYAIGLSAAVNYSW